jgi:hypothetical protein
MAGGTQHGDAFNSKSRGDDHWWMVDSVVTTSVWPLLVFPSGAASASPSDTMRAIVSTVFPAKGGIRNLRNRYGVSMASVWCQHGISMVLVWC